MSDYGVQTLADYLDSSTGVKSYDTTSSLLGNPSFLYANGIISGDQLYSSIQNLLYEPIDISTADWQTFENDAYRTGDDVLSEGYSLIKQGMSSDRVLAALSKKYADSYGSLDDNEMNQLTYLKSNLDSFSKAWSNAQDIEAKKSLGIYQEDENGNILAPVDWNTGFQRLRGIGLDQYQANPDLWRAIPDAAYLSQAEALQQQIDTSAVGIERLAKQTNKESQATAEDVYAKTKKDFVSSAIEKKKSKTQPDNFASMRGTGAVTNTNASKGATKTGDNFASMRGTGATTNTNASKGSTKKVDNFASTRGTPATSQPKPSKRELEIADYWAKLAASYAGRASQETKSKQMQQAKNEQASLERRRDLALQQARQNTSVPGLQMAAMAPLISQSLSRGGGRSAGPRVLSDAEIESMSNMIAGGMQ